MAGKQLVHRPGNTVIWGVQRVQIWQEFWNERPDIARQLIVFAKIPLRSQLDIVESSFAFGSPVRFDAALISEPITNEYCQGD